jgi:signal transduction histidine kinase
VRALKAYTYLDQAPRQTVNLHDGLDNTLIILRSKLQQGVTVHRHYAPDLPLIDAYGSELNQVWTNLLDNSIDAMNGRGEIALRTRREGEWVVVEVEDNGPGIPTAIQANIFDPFFTTKPPGQGTGMGLNISHNIIVQRHKGRIDLHSQPGLTRFEVRLPLHSSTTA